MQTATLETNLVPGGWSRSPVSRGFEEVKSCSGCRDGNFLASGPPEPSTKPRESVVKGPCVQGEPCPGVCWGKELVQKGLETSLWEV